MSHEPCKRERRLTLKGHDRIAASELAAADIDDEIVETLPHGYIHARLDGAGRREFRGKRLWTLGFRLWGDKNLESLEPKAQRLSIAATPARAGG